MRSFLVFCLAAAVLSVVDPLFAQEEDVFQVPGEMLETIIAGRGLALRLRGEVQLTDDDDELIDQDPNYARFPSRIYSSEAKLYQNNRSTMAFSHARWENEQELEIDRLAWKMWIPMFTGDPVKESHLTLQYRREDGFEDDPEWNYLYVGLDKYWQNGVYAYLQYRHASRGSERFGHQFREYVSWKPTTRLRIGQEAAFANNRGGDGPEPWYVNLFGTIFVREDRSSLRLEARYYMSTTGLNYQRLTLYWYERLGARCFARLNYRFYDDSDDRSSHALGGKVRHFFTPRFAAPLGYRYYDHSEGADFDTFFGGLEYLF